MNNLVPKLLIVTSVIGAALIVGYGTVTYAISERLSDIRLQTEVLLAEQKTSLVSIAEATARNGADGVTESIVQDCAVSERARFDDLLSRLNNRLSQPELIELDRLFGRCGSFYADRKAVMAARLQREIQVFEVLVTQLSHITGNDKSIDYSVPLWLQLAELEVKQSVLFSDLVRDQESIISTLIAGKSAESTEIATILEGVQSTQQTLIVTHAQAAELRSQLIQ